MEKLLVIADPMDHPPTAIEKALALAKYNDDCSIHILIFCYVTLSEFADAVDGGEAALKKQILDDQNSKWTHVLAQYQGESTLTYELLWEKDLSSFTLLHCKDKNYDLVVKTGHRSESILHTPEDWRLMRESPYPVYIAYDRESKQKQVILAAVDLLTKDEDKQQLNRKVLESAFRLAMHTNAVLHVCYTIKIPKLVRDMDLIDVPRKTRQLEEKAREVANRLLDEYQVESENLHINEGTPGEVIAQIANSLKASCTVVGTIGRSGVSGKLIGNTCETTLHYLRGDQLVVSL